MSANCNIAGRTPEQVRVAKLATDIYKQCGFTSRHVLISHLMEEPVAEQLAGHDDLSLGRIIWADPSLVVPLMGGHRTTRTWLLHTARAVILHELHRIVGIDPRFAPRGDERWTFLGRDLRDYDGLAPTDQEEQRSPEDYEVVDLWASSNGERVVVVYGRGQHDYISAPTNEPHTNSNVREALRRFDLVEIHASV